MAIINVSFIKDSTELGKNLHLFFQMDWENTTITIELINTAWGKISGKEVANFFVRLQSHKAIKYKGWNMAYTLFILTL